MLIKITFVLKVQQYIVSLNNSIEQIKLFLGKKIMQLHVVILLLKMLLCSIIAIQIKISYTFDFKTSFKLCKNPVLRIRIQGPLGSRSGLRIFGWIRIK